MDSSSIENEFDPKLDSWSIENGFDLKMDLSSLESGFDPKWIKIEPYILKKNK